VTAERLSIDQDSGEVIFAGDVLLAQGDLRLSAGEIYMRYVDGDAGAGVAEIRATGQVLLARGDDAAQGNQALYDVPNGMFTFQGDVMITQADAVIQGQALVIDLNTGIGEIQGRVRTVLGTGSAE
jgi:lipopolysaccharide export system protein LptA